MTLASFLPALIADEHVVFGDHLPRWTRPYVYGGLLFVAALLGSSFIDAPVFTLSGLLQLAVALAVTVVVGGIVLGVVATAVVFLSRSLSRQRVRRRPGRRHRHRRPGDARERPRAPRRRLERPRGRRADRCGGDVRRALPRSRGNVLASARVRAVTGGSGRWRPAPGGHLRPSLDDRAYRAASKTGC
ncbi:hypothetical protein ACFQS4_00515 [Saliphagus sp. GCM10025317]